MLRKAGVLVLVAGSLALAGCGGSSSGGSSSGSAQPAAVAGPLDALQTTLTSSVFDPLESATAGTPLQGVLSCADQGVNQNLLDTVDALLNGLQNPATLASTTPAQVQAELQALVGNLTGLLTALAGSGDCNGTSSLGSNPLAGTPLAALGNALLPQLQSLQAQLSGGQLGLGTLSGLFTQLQQTLQGALQQLPSSATSAPVLGGLLSTLETTLGDLGTLINTVGSSPANVPAAVATTLQDLLNGLTTQVIPLGQLQQISGQSGSTSPLSQVKSAIQTVVQQVQNALIQGSTLSGLLGAGQTSGFTGPLTQLVSQLTTPLRNALAGISSTGNPVSDLLSSLLPTVTNVLTTLLGIGTTSSSCVFSSLPLLSALCPVLP